MPLQPYDQIKIGFNFLFGILLAIKLLVLIIFFALGVYINRIASYKKYTAKLFRPLILGRSFKIGCIQSFFLQANSFSSFSENSSNKNFEMSAFTLGIKNFLPKE